MHNTSSIRLYHDKRIQMIVEYFYVEYVFNSKIQLLLHCCSLHTMLQFEKQMKYILMYVYTSI